LARAGRTIPCLFLAPVKAKAGAGGRLRKRLATLHRKDGCDAPGWLPRASVAWSIGALTDAPPVLAGPSMK